jgi:hypothetical protein
MIAFDMDMLTKTNIQAISTTVPVNFDFATAAVVSFVLMLLGMAVAFLLMLRFANRTVQKESE